MHLHSSVRSIASKEVTFTSHYITLHVSSLSKYNENFKFLLTCIDVLSKYAWVVPLKNKSGKTITDASWKIIIQRRPIHLQTDKGSEFKNKLFQSFLEDSKIKFYTSENHEIKAAVVEPFNRTLKYKMYRYFTYKGTRRYVDVLADLVHSYNHTFHTSIKMAPVKVTVQNESEVGSSSSSSSFYFSIW